MYLLRLILNFMIISFLYDGASLYVIFIDLLLLIVDFGIRVILFLVMICLIRLTKVRIGMEDLMFLIGFGRIIRILGLEVYFIHCLLNLLCLFSMASNLYSDNSILSHILRAIFV